MKLAIIADSHDNLFNLHKTLDYLKKQKIELLIHCGDVCAPSALRELAKNFPGQIHLVYGNVDGDHPRMEQVAAELTNIKIHGEAGNLEVEGQKIGWTHFPDAAKSLAKSGNYQLVFYGHTHQPWEEWIGSVRLLNPGTLAGMFNKATFAIYEPASGKAELVLLEKL